MNKSENIVEKKEPKNYREQLKQDLEHLIDQTGLESLQKQFMKARWLDLVFWLEGRADKCRNRYYRLRMQSGLAL